MGNRIALSTMQANTIDILNAIRNGASQEYRDNVPAISKIEELPHVGECIFGYPAFANYAQNALMNRIIAVMIKKNIFNNPYKDLKKGSYEYGSVIEEVFNNLYEAHAFDVEKAYSEEFKREAPTTRVAFHSINYKSYIKVSIDYQGLKQAFLSGAEGFYNFIDQLVGNVVQSAEYYEFLLFKYVLIKTVAKGEAYPVSIGDGTDPKEAVKKFRAYSNKITFKSKKYNRYNVATQTAREDQVIFMDSDYNAEQDVEVLASAFNMDKATFMGKLYLIDDFTSFDNEAFDAFRAESDSLEEVTPEELQLMKGVKAILCDRDFFQFYDTLFDMRTQDVTMGLYTNYVLHIWKVISTSPFSNIIVFATNNSISELPATITAKVADKSVSDQSTVINLWVDLAGDNGATINGGVYQFIQTKEITQAGVGIQPYGSVMFPKNAGAVNLEIKMGDSVYKADTNLDKTANVGDTIQFTKQ